jgi:CheY-like chemotaxis protein
MTSAPEARPTVLVVDDDADTRVTLRDLLEEEGYGVLEAAGGSEALKFLRSSLQRLVVLLDYVMPRLDGLAVLHQVAQDPAQAQRHAFVLVSARRLSYRLGVLRLLQGLRVPVVVKPFDIQTILDAVAQAAATLQVPVPIQRTRWRGR